MIRRAGLVVAGVAAAILAVRVAAVDAFAGQRPELAARVWPGHPRVVTARGLGAIAASVASGRPPAPAITAELRSVIRGDPLNSGALLVAGTETFAAGDLARSERLLLAASSRDPHAPAPRFLLADLYLRQGNGPAGLVQVEHLLRRLGPNAASLLPALAQFATTPGGAQQLRPLLASQPELRDRLLELLAADPRHLPVVLSLAGPPQRGAAPAWQNVLLSGMIARQDYQRAHDVWRRLANIPANSKGLFNPRLVPAGPPPPFNWRLNSGSAGIAEFQAGGGLHLLHYGREDAVLAEQVMLLPPGRYQLEQESTGRTANLSWALTCLPAGARAEAPLKALLRFTVQAGCQAQRLELRGSVGDSAGSADATIRRLVLTRVGG